jgi:hypothetical protein
VNIWKKLFGINESPNPTNMLTSAIADTKKTTSLAISTQAIHPSSLLHASEGNVRDDLYHAFQSDMGIAKSVHGSLPRHLWRKRIANVCRILSF